MLVIGGGPAGSTVAAVLAERGRHVILIDKDRHPRFHIGESLLPMNLPIFERLGVLDKVRELGVHKPGAEFGFTADPNDRQTFSFAKAKGDSPLAAFQVRRSDFDMMLMENAAEKGATVLHETRATEIDPVVDDKRVVYAKGPEGEALTYRASYVIDASGRDTFMARKRGWKKKNPQHNTAAIFGHFDNADLLPGDGAGNIGIYWFKHGWVWMIPLVDGTMSAGAVCFPEYLKTRKGSPDEFLWETLNSCAPAERRLRNATLKSRTYAAGNYSYFSRQAREDRCLLVGDAYAFLDPVFSSGVYLAMAGGERIGQITDTLLDQPQLEKQLMREHERYMLRGMKIMGWFIYRFMSPQLRALFMKPRNVWQIEEAIISVLAGDVFGQTPIRGQLMAFKTVYYIHLVMQLPGALRAWLRRKRNWRVSVEASD
ncbi:NAD(P)/FAD-dependent oxidoreductase [Alkalilimnicola sp. S0819]|uniref:NAD(P)/FAD-dependent oxidoreductase n=1 Tax=Alkalilimnicola sp. S0819 TaxID=2613922 RepID=UPI00126217A8|nr:NAD(P)/FAD-dependent oxidoreductase [Alkalilimnicola sp. S0819]KAB7624239.1 NAD(P)/FAD-dependent oxidoreductase [Alkalilimnicola sp. S0819]MPQ16428.1 NAD(P)-binding protein [Alkalilimnicola sp. S0819]